MKKLIFLSLILLNLSVIIYAQHSDSKINASISSITVQGDHYVTEDDECKGGGPGSVSCATNLNGFSCSVTCGNAKYACCTGERCICKPILAHLTPAN